jgi:hypothetical protein
MLKGMTQKVTLILIFTSWVCLDNSIVSPDNYVSKILLDIKEGKRS